MDIKQFDVKTAVEKGHTFTLVYPDFDPEGRGGDPTDVTIDVYGVGSAAYEKASDDIEAYQTKCWSKDKPVNKEHLKTLQIALVVACTRGWNGFEEDGKPYPYTKANAEKLFSENEWIVVQVIKEIGNVKAMLEKK